MKVGVVGIGNMGKNHARIYSEMPDCELIGVNDPNIKKWNDTKVYSSAEKLFQDCDCVSIATPTNTHKEIACEALKYCDVLLEKPIAPTKNEALQIIQAAKDNNHTLMIGQVERFNPVVTYLKRFSAERFLTLNFMRLGISPPKNPTTGIITDLAIHDIDLFRYLTNEEITNGIACKESFDLTPFDDSAHIFLESPSSSASIVANWFNPKKIRHIYASLISHFIYADLIEQTITIHEKLESADSVQTVKLQKQEPLRLEIEEFLDAVKQKRKPLVCGEDATESLCVAENLEKYGMC